MTAEAWRDAVRRHLPAAVELRHALHAAPRLGGVESATTQTVVDALGLGEGRTVAGTGRLLPVAPGPAPVVLRAELDALPVVEASGLPWASTNGAMHACGHDVHLAGLAAVVMAAADLDLPRPVTALLQPREEGADSGARDVVADGAMDDVHAIVAAHVQPRLPAGTIAATPGPVNAATDEFTVTVTGHGGHSGYPHTVDDSVLALSAIVVALQQVGARRVDPTVGVACMVNQLRAGTANNVVPSIAVGSGTVRTMREQDRAVAHAAIRDIAQHVAAGHGCAAEVEIDVAEPPLLNDPRLAVAAGELLTGFGHEVDSSWRSFGSDDFSYYSAHTRSLMLFVGTGDERGGLHEATFWPDDDYVGVVADALIAGYCAALR
ncbi:M20 metallopeptidase family protein [Nocardioides mangrovicus]|uniref:M20 metallopeptidase family protein n=1 Tax=Nocardioides mangrovicus TaxID=2478913 RepID=UPI001E31DD72|nr:amidohydrolase [Nocardioides mangrovicus]